MPSPPHVPRPPAAGPIVAGYHPSREASIHENEARLRQLIDAASDGVYRINPYGVFTWANQVVPRLLGLEGESVVGRLYLEFVRRDYHEEGIELYKRQVREKIPVTYWEFPVVRADGSELWVGQNVQVETDEAGLVSGLFAIARDITARKQAELALRDSEARHRFLSEHSTDVLTRLTPEGIIRSASPVFHMILGRPEQQLIGMSLFELCHPEDLSRVRGAVARLLGDSAVETTTIRIRRSDGGWVWFESTMQAIREKTHVVELLAVSRDVTHRLRMEEELRRAAAMNAVAKLAGGIAEEFGELLARIQAVSDVLRERTPADDPRLPELLEIWRTSDRAGQLTRQLLALAGRQALRLEMVDLNRVVADLEPVIARLLGGAIRVTCERDSRLPPIVADPGQLEQVVLHLARVAKAAMPDGGELRLVTHTEDVQALDGQPRRHAVLSVRDSGVGMDQETRARIFEPFFEAGPGGDSGLGLAGVYGVVVQSGGTITVDSTPGEGSCFVLRFPAG